MTSSRPYLIRAIYEWIVDNTKTPYLLVDAAYRGVVVPEAYIENDRIILNISPAAAHNISMSDEDVSFSARFKGQAMNVFIPVMAVLAIYAKENGQGMMFAGGDEDDDPAVPPDDDGPDGKGPGGSKPDGPKLRLIK